MERKVYLGTNDYLDQHGIRDVDNEYNLIPNHELTSGETTAEINSHGAYVYELSSSGQEVFFPKGSYKNQEGVEKVRGGCHLCFPNFGPSDESSDLPQHGPTRTMDWDTIVRSQNSVELQRTIDDIHARLVYTIEDNSFEANLHVMNETFDDKPFAPGFHPYFDVGTETEVKINGQVLDLDKDAEMLKNTVYMEGVETLEIDGKTYNFENKGLNNFAIWSGGETADNGNRYICVEPTAEGSTFSEGQTPSNLSGGQRKTYSFKISW